jgi:hypothetical protein
MLRSPRILLALLGLATLLGWAGLACAQEPARGTV